jgi:hypothetical protein
MATTGDPRAILPRIDAAAMSGGTADILNPNFRGIPHRCFADDPNIAEVTPGIQRAAVRCGQ